MQQSFVCTTVYWKLDLFKTKNSDYLKVQPVIVLCVNKMGARVVRSVEHSPPGESPGIVSSYSVKDAPPMITCAELIN